MLELVNWPVNHSALDEVGCISDQNSLRMRNEFCKNAQHNVTKFLQECKWEFMQELTCPDMIHGKILSNEKSPVSQIRT